MPLVSVVMPVYNQERYLERALASMLAQTFTDFEFIVVNDGSTDGTNEILSRIDDPRVRIENIERGGFLRAIEHGIRCARGKWIARMDSDDIAHPDRLRRQLKFIEEHPECLFVGNVYGIVTPNDKYLVPQTGFEWRYLAPRDITLATELFADPSAIFDRQHALDADLYDPDFENEKPLYYKLLARGRGAVLGEPLHFIRWRLGSVSRSNFEKWSITNRDVRLRYNPDDADPNQVFNFTTNERASVKAAERCVRYYLLAGDLPAARETAFETLRTWPFSTRAWKIALKALTGRPTLGLWRDSNLPFIPVEFANGKHHDHESPAFSRGAEQAGEERL